MSAASIVIMCVGRPPSPTLSVEEVGDRWVRVSWTSADNRYAPVRNFTLQKRLLSSSRRLRRSDDEFTSAANYLPSTLRNYTVSGSVQVLSKPIQIGPCMLMSFSIHLHGLHLNAPYGQTRHLSTQLCSGERTGRRLLWSTTLLLPTLVVHGL